MSQSYQYTLVWREECKRKLIEGFGGKCGICGRVDDPIAYDFHHLDPNEKEDEITRRIKSWAWIMVEIKKCVMLCAHCHTKHHVDGLEIPSDIQMYDDSLVSYRVSEKDKMDACPVCGKDKRVSMSTCSHKCAAVKSRKVDWDNIDPYEVLRQHGGNYSAAARSLGINGNSLKKRIKKLEGNI